MKRTESRMRLCVLLLILNLLFIWGNSLLPDTQSSALSAWVGRLLGTLFSGVNAGVSGGGHLIRKLAHFFEFCGLGLWLAWLLGMVKGRKIALPILLGFMAACLDETIQSFVPGRHPALRDVGIDTCGVSLGVILIFLGQYIRKNQHYLEETK